MTDEEKKEIHVKSMYYRLNGRLVGVLVFDYVFDGVLCISLKGDMINIFYYYVLYNHVHIGGID